MFLSFLNPYLPILVDLSKISFQAIEKPLRHASVVIQQRVFNLLNLNTIHCFLACYWGTDRLRFIIVMRSWITTTEENSCKKVLKLVFLILRFITYICIIHEINKNYEHLCVRFYEKSRKTTIFDNRLNVHSAARIIPNQYFSQPAVFG